jgi:hypothetical protein
MTAETAQILVSRSPRVRQWAGAVRQDAPIPPVDEASTRHLRARTA